MQEMKCVKNDADSTCHLPTMYTSADMSCCLQSHRKKIKYNLINSNLNMYFYHYTAVCEWQTFHCLTAVVLFSAQPHKY